LILMRILIQVAKLTRIPPDPDPGKFFLKVTKSKIFKLKKGNRSKNIPTKV
jgi:hypothetical protein